MRVITFGQFNIVHAGHIDLFQQSKQLAQDGTLIVCAAADSIVEFDKGTFTPLRDRLAVLMACRYIDVVDIYGDTIVVEDGKNVSDYIQDAEQKLIDFYAPDIITFGNDKDVDYYSYLNFKGRSIQLPRIGRGVSSREIIASGVDPILKKNTDAYYFPGGI